MSLAVERIVILPVISGIRDTAAVSIMSINTVTNAVSGVDLTATDPIVVDALAAYQLQASAQVATLTEDLATKTALYDAEVAKVTALTTEKSTLTTEKTQLASDLATADATIVTLTNEKTQLTAQVEALTSQLEAIATELVTRTAELADSNIELFETTTENENQATAITALEQDLETATSQLESTTAEKATLTTQLTEAAATIATLQAEVTKLTAIRAYNPRWTTPDFFQNRFTVKTARLFERSDDPVIAGGRDLLDYYEANKFYVDLDDAQVQGLTAYMVQLGMLTEAERTHVLRDATAAEAWYPE